MARRLVLVAAPVALLAAGCGSSGKSSAPKTSCVPRILSLGLVPPMRPVQVAANYTTGGKATRWTFTLDVRLIKGRDPANGDPTTDVTTIRAFPGTEPGRHRVTFTVKTPCGTAKKSIMTTAKLPPLPPPPPGAHKP